ncbi:hypothetical protein V5O48_012542 [Marasmius crinis-equi]|uniref:Ubiquitin-like protease family profile domain-containing protein n=1 Tax=Marasmius crinis-equi TaxID=585013 RepID=A0ABR3F2K0_9AGAR
MAGVAKRGVLGRPQPSPRKKRNKRDQESFSFNPLVARRRTMEMNLQRLRNPLREPPVDIPTPATTAGESSATTGNPLPTSPSDDQPPDDSSEVVPDHVAANDEFSMDIDTLELDDALPPPSACSPPRRSRKSIEENLAQRWNQLLPTLVDPLLKLRDRTFGILPGERGTAPGLCAGNCMLQVSEIHAIYFDHHCSQTFRHCRCRSLAQVLVDSGLFPTSPSQPRMAIAIPLLDFYQALSQSSSDAVTALAGGLASVYRRQGFRLLSASGEAAQDPIRRALGHSLEWYDTLVVRIDQYVTKKVEVMKRSLPCLPDTISTHTSSHAQSTAFQKVFTALKNVPSMPEAAPLTSTSSPPAMTSLPPTTTSPPISQIDVSMEPNKNLAKSPSSPGRAHPYLQRACKACYGGMICGLSFQEGGDVHVAVDANFHHRHLKSGGDGVTFQHSIRWISKETIQVVDARITTARAKPPKLRTPDVPDEIVDSDRDSHQAANGDTKKESSKAFDENGVMALVCCHDIPLFLASIDTPGEQQKYSVALLEALFETLPPCATVGALYDIACVLDRSIHLYDLFSEVIVDRLQLATAAMHSYAHQWVCQLFYNPRMRMGLGLTDGEGVERLWSRLRKLIGIERRASRAVRLWLLDRQCDSITEGNNDGLGKWIQRRLHKNVQKKEAEAVKFLRVIALPVETLREYWSEQKASQSSVRSLAPARLKKELTKVLQLQAQIDGLEEEIAEVRATIKKMVFTPSDTSFRLRNLEGLHAKLKVEADKLYTSLNIDNQYPELTNIPLEYLHALILARDLKIAIRKKAVGSFFEWDRLDSAVGGTHEALGTRVHQVTRTAISKRKAAFESQIRKFNQHVTYLEEHHRPHFRIPIPKRLPTELASLRDMETSHLWEDVWIEQVEMPPQWLVNEDIRKGIRAVLTLDRCAEERVRLQTEAKNMCSWFRDELQALKVMTADPQYSKYHTPLRLRLQDHLLLAESWSNPFVSAATFRAQVALVERWLAESFPVSMVYRATDIERPSTHSLNSGLPQPPVLNPTLYQPQPTSVPPTVSQPQPTLASPSTAPTQPRYLNAVAARFFISPEEHTERSEASISDMPAAQTGEGAGEGEDDDDDEIEITGEGVALQDVFEAADSDDEEDLHLIWETPTPFKTDSLFSTAFKRWAFGQLKKWNSPRSFKSSAGWQYVFNTPQYKRIDGERERLDEDLMNGCAVLLQQSLHVPGDEECAILSSYIVPELVRKVSKTETAWRTARRAAYWTKPVWLIPIHDKLMEHWALAVVKVEKEEILIFDSFGCHSFISEWLPRIHLIMRRLISMAKDHGFVSPFPSLSDLASWTARPLHIVALQTNSYDCGLWVLWVMAAVIRGFDYAAIEEKDIVKFRKYLARLIRTVPV